MAFNPFSKKTPNPQQQIEDERNFSHKENIMVNATHPQSTEDNIYIDQQAQRSDLIKWQQDLSPEIQIMIHKIRREHEVSDGKWHTPEGMVPIANNTFIMDMVGLIDMSTSKNLINSNYSEDRVLMALQSTLFSFRCMLQENREFYDIRKPDMHLIVRLFKSAIEPTYWRCWNNGERKYAGEFNKRVEVHSDVPVNQKKSLFGMGG